MKRVYAALVHHPVRNREGHVVTTAVTNLDVHDLARSSRTYDLAGLFIVTPIEAQQKLVRSILAHWEQDAAGGRRIPQRSEALGRCTAVPSIEDAVRDIELREGQAPLRVVTTARVPEGKTAIGYAEGARRFAHPERPILLLFGTGHGLTSSVLDAADLILAPIRPAGAYNHLSVRSAAAIIFDRLFGEVGPRD